MKKYFLILVALMTVTGNLYAQKKYKIGDYYDVNGKKGVVFSVNAEGTHGKAVSLNEYICTWENGLSYDAVGATNTSNGHYNSRMIMEHINATRASANKYPAYAYCTLEGGYLPSLNEVKAIFNNKQAINATLYKLGRYLIKGKMWTSTEKDAVRAYHVYMDSGEEYASEKIENDRRARAVFTF